MAPPTKQKPNDVCGCGSPKKLKFKKCCGAGGRAAGPVPAPWDAPDRPDRLVNRLFKAASRDPPYNGAPGFSFGKLRGAEAAVFAAACFSLVDATREAFHDVPYNSPHCVLFKRQTPHLRIELIAQVAVGMLVPNVPLPADTPELHATYLAIWLFVHDKVIFESECAGVLSQCRGAGVPEEEQIESGVTPQMKTEDVETEVTPPQIAQSTAQDSPPSSTSDKLTEDNEYVMMGRADDSKSVLVKQKLARRMKKDAEVLAAAAGASRPVPLETGFCVATFAKQCETLSNSGALNVANGAGNPDLSPTEMLALAEMPEHHSQHWRLLFLACIDERCKGERIIALSPDSLDNAAWTMQYRVFAGAGFIPCATVFELGGGTNYEFDARRHGKDAGERARYAKLLTYLAAMRVTHEDSWRPAHTVRAEATLLLLKPPLEELWWVGVAAFRADNFRDGTLAKTVFSIGVCASAPDVTAAARAIKLEQETNTPRHDSVVSHSMRMKVENVKCWGANTWWVLPWHEAMAAEGGDYSALVDRLAALATLSDDDLERSPAPWAPCVGEFTSKDCGAPTQGLTAPWDWRNLHEAIESEGDAHTTRCFGCGAMESATGTSHKRCGGCDVARYCSTACQESDWGVHKARCKRWQELESQKDDDWIFK